jgi:hypothetical protein
MFVVLLRQEKQWIQGRVLPCLFFEYETKQLDVYYVVRVLQAQRKSA